MVMHARKPQRISDGYFEKHQTHPYQKYSSKSDRRTTEYTTDNRYTPLRSPNGNVSSHGHGTHTSHSSHSHHHYSHGTDDRGYISTRNSFVPKGSEEERDRDYKTSRNKYTDSVRSPKEKHRSNHERSESEKKSRTSNMNISVSRSTNKYDKRSVPSASVISGSEWSEHISSSGKKYYYNSLSEVSQWEKPREWDSRRTASKETVRTRDKRSSSRSERREVEKSSKRINSASDRYWNNSSREEEHERTRSKHAHTTHDSKEGQTLQDMDISPDRSTPLSEHSFGARGPQSAQPRPEAPAVPPVVVLDNSNQTSGSLLAAALPRISSAPILVASGPSGLHPSGGAGACGAPGGSGANNGRASPVNECSPNATPRRDAGPPTPTHAESADPHAPPIHLELALPRKMECLGGYAAVVGSNLQQAPPMLTPSLVNYVRCDLIAHVNGWPADILEKQAHKYGEEAYQLGCLQCTRVSAELKCSRSLVRHTEIQATLQEQKIMYLRQQIIRLEELKSQNSFMSED